MYLVRRHKRRISGFLNSDSRQALWIAGIVTVSLVACLASVLVWVGAPAMNGRPGDVPICLDGAWRIANGQVIHRDFYSHLGALPFYLTWIGMKLSHPSVSSIMYGNVVAMVILSLLGLFILMRRTSAGYACLFSCFTAVLVVTPRALGEPYDFVDHAMVYNRLGEAILILLSVVVLVPPRDATSVRAGAFDAALAGLLLAALWFTKISCFVVGIAVLGTAAVFRCLSLGRVVLCAGVAVVVTALFLAITRIPLQAMVDDFRLTLVAQGAVWRAKNLLIQAAKQGLPLLLIAILTAEAFSGEPLQPHKPLARFRAWIISALLFSGSVFLLASNCQTGELPLLSVAALYSVELIRRQSKLTSHTPQLAALRSSIACGLLFALVLPTFGTDLATIRHATRETATRHFVSSEILKDTNLRDFRFSPTGTRDLFSRTYLESVEDGVQLLRRQTNSGMRLVVILFANPFHMALGLPPAEGGTICWVWNTWDPRSHLPLSRVLGNATHVLASPGCLDLKNTYGAEWDSMHPEIIEETKHFTLVKIR